MSLSWSSIIYEIEVGEVPEDLAREAMRLAGAKFPFGTALLIVNREEVCNGSKVMFSEILHFCSRSERRLYKEKMF